MAKSKKEVAEAQGKTVKVINKLQRVEVTLTQDILGFRAGDKIMTHPENVKALLKAGRIKSKK